MKFKETNVLFCKRGNYFDAAVSSQWVMTLRGLLDESKGPGKKRGSFMIFTLMCVIKIKFHGRKVETIWDKLKKNFKLWGHGSFCQSDLGDDDKIEITEIIVDFKS